MFTGTKFSETFLGRQLHQNVKLFWHIRDWLVKTVEFLEIFSKHFILILLVLSFYVWEGWLCVCWYILCRILYLETSFSLLRITSCLFSYFVSLSYLFISSMADSFLLASFSPLNLSTPQGYFLSWYFWFIASCSILFLLLWQLVLHKSNGLLWQDSNCYVVGFVISSLAIYFCYLKNILVFL